MKKLTGYTAILTALLIAFALVYPYVHIFEHSFSQDSVSKDHTHIVQMDKNIVKSGMDCKICDFHFSGFDSPKFFTFDLFIPNKESVYSLSLSQTIWDCPDPYFSLRAPPAIRA